MITSDNQLIKLFVIISNSVANYEGKGFSYIRKYGTGLTCTATLRCSTHLIKRYGPPDLGEG